MNEKTSWAYGIEFDKQASDEAARRMVEGAKVIGTMLGGEEATCDCGLPLDQCVENGGPGLSFLAVDMGENHAADALGFLGRIVGVANEPSVDEDRDANVEALISIRSSATAQLGRVLESLTQATLTHQQMVQALTDDIEDVIDGQF